MPANEDIKTCSDIDALLRVFYTSVFDDALLRPIFVDVAHLDQRIEAHLPRIGDFWQSVLFRSGDYDGGAFGVHKSLNDLTPLTTEHFDRWLTLWTKAVREHHDGPIADLAVKQAQRFANAFQRRLNADEGGNQSVVAIRPRS